jgi:Hypothetical protein (DUF2513)
MTLTNQSHAHFIVALNPTGRLMMNRDMSIIRRIFAEIRARNDIIPRTVEIPDIEGWRVDRHVELLTDAGFIDGLSGGGAYNDLAPKIAVRDLTTSGHDFAAALETEGVWQDLKGKFTAAEFAALPLKVVQGVAGELLMSWAKKKAGV